MNDFANWLILSATALLLFFGIYRLLLGRLNLLKAGRIYLIATILMALLLPLPWQRLLNNPIEIAYAINLDLATVFPIQDQTINNQGFDWQTWLLFIYLIPVVLLLGFFLYSNLRILIMLRQGEKISKQKAKIVLLDRNLLPFSWFGIIVLSRKDFHSPHVEKIIAHEIIHIRQKHVIDLIFAEILIVLQWFNPAAWSYRQALRNVHEYLADKGTLQSGYRIKDYQQLLSGLAGPVPAGIVSNNIKHSFLKNRFIMMTKAKPGKLAQLRLVAAALIAIILGWGVFNTACLAQNQKPKQTNAQQETKQQPVEPSADTTGKVQNKVVSTTDDQKEVFSVVEEAPTFPGGDKARLKFLLENVNYPQEARMKGIQGTVFISFVIEMDGSVTNVKVLKGIGGGCDEEAVRVIEKMPKWNPGKQRLKTVRVQYTMPITFLIGEIEEDEPAATMQGKAQERVVSTNKGKEEVSILMEVPPTFPGGDRARIKFLQENICYPQMARESGIQGVVYVQFVVERDGSVSDVKVLRGIGGGCDEEAVRVVEKMPKWNPGKQPGGESVKVQYTMPIKFTLDRTTN